MTNSGEMERLLQDNDTTIFRTSCSCFSHDHAMTIFFENENGHKSMSFTYKSYLKGHYISRKYCDTWGEWFIEYGRYLWECLKYRSKTALKVFFTGYVEMDADLIFRDEKQILAMAEAMIDLVKADQPQPKS